MVETADKPRAKGRPPRNDGRQKFTTKLHPATIELLREIGSGNANDGIERLIVAFRDRLTIRGLQAKRELKRLGQQHLQGE